MVIPGTDGDEGTHWRRGLAGSIAAPAGDGPSLLIPQVWSHPALTEVKEPAGGVAWPYSSLPQQATEPLLLTPQVCATLALTEVKEPAGGVAWPYSYLPQQATEQSPFTPQVWLSPALTETKEPVGGVAWPP